MSNINNTTYLSSTFTNRMIAEGVVRFRPLTIEEAREIVSLAEGEGVLKNVLNPRHESTCALAEGLTKLPPQGGFVSLAEGDSMVIMLPSVASRDATEFSLSHFNECEFSLAKVLPMS